MANTRHPIPVTIADIIYPSVITLGDASLIQSMLDMSMSSLCDRVESDDVRYEFISAIIGVTIGNKYPKSGISYDSVMNELYDRGAEDCMIEYIYPALLLIKQFSCPKGFLENAEALFAVGKSMERAIALTKKKEVAKAKADAAKVKRKAAATKKATATKRKPRKRTVSKTTGAT